MSGLDASRRPPPLVLQLAQAVADVGGRAYIVGGWVRDLHLGLSSKDIDVEVHGVEEPELEALLRRLGRVNAVGRSFGVYKLSTRSLELDVSLPRRDSKVGPGHRGIAVAGDPHMGVREAARRRDLTLNALLLDPLTGETLDPFGGLHDMQAKLLREVDPETFVEDPLRALRAVQFAARFGFGIAPSLAELCRQSSLTELPPERIRGELDKLLLSAARPGPGLLLLEQLALSAQVLPELHPHINSALAQALDRAVAHRSALAEEGERSALMYGAMLSPLRGEALLAVLDRLALHSVQRYPMRDALLKALAALDRWPQPPDDSGLRGLSDQLVLEGMLRLGDTLRPGQGWDLALQRAQALGVDRGPLPRLLQGADLLAQGLPAGPQMGALLARLRAAQVAGEIQDREQALVWLRTAGPEGDPERE